jgi:WD40 repeat protein
VLVGSEGNGEPIHTFTSNNDLLVACGYKIQLFSLESNKWVKKYEYELPRKSFIVCITANLSNEMFSCGDLSGDVYIYNNTTKELVHTFTTRVLLMRTDHHPEITSLAFNEHLLVVSSIGDNNLILDLNTMVKKKIEKPYIQYSGSYLKVKNYLICPCLTKFIGTFCNRTFMWDINGDIIRQLDFTLEKYCIFSPKGTKLVSIGNTFNVIDWTDY